MRATFDGEIVRIAGLLQKDTEAQTNSQKTSTLDNPEEELKEIDANLTKSSIDKIVQDFHESLQKALDALGACSNVEKHMNELVHRANFRFSDLHIWVNQSKTEFAKCNELQICI